MNNKSKRIYFLDELRGFAVICMIFHHFFLDLGDVLSVSAGYEIFDALCVFQPVFWAIFIIVSGICSQLSRNSIKRGGIVFACAMAVTTVTALIMPSMGFYECEIYFGVLHFLGISMIISGLLKPLIAKINPYAGMAVCAFLFFFTYNISNGSLAFGIELPQILYKTNYLMPLGFHNSAFHSADYFPLFPWLFMYIFGSFAGKFAAKGAFPDFMYKKHSKPLCFVGKNALWFYLGHQVVIYAILYIVSLILLVFA